ncbi:MAG TPA: hypothetical protein VFF06_09030 [Polyangia bacterium]|nr:hypothetical protein [Polyangia bacterium]
MSAISRSLLVLALGAWPAAAAARIAVPEGGRGGMRNCPTVVPGARVEPRNLADGVELRVLAESPAAREQIRRRADRLVRAAQTRPQAMKHDGRGHGGGGIGRCPVVMKDTHVLAEPIAGGARIVVEPRRRIDSGWLRRETVRRLNEAERPAM